MFEEVKTVFFDEFALQFYDEEYSEEEDRFILLGMSDKSRLHFASHCERNEGNTMRIISACKATKKKSAHYTRGAS